MIYNCVGTGCPALKDLNDYVRNGVGKKWFDLGLQLLDAEDEETLSKIETDNCRDTDKCVTEMFRLWKRRKSDACWDQLIKALKKPSINLDVLAESIQNLLLPEGMYIFINGLCICIWYD